MIVGVTRLTNLAMIKKALVTIGHPSPMFLELVHLELALFYLHLKTFGVVAMSNKLYQFIPK